MRILYWIWDKTDKDLLVLNRNLIVLIPIDEDRAYRRVLAYIWNHHPPSQIVLVGNTHCLTDEESKAMVELGVQFDDSIDDLRLEEVSRDIELKLLPVFETRGMVVLPFSKYLPSMPPVERFRPERAALRLVH